jgi:hypothetical protein
MLRPPAADARSTEVKVVSPFSAAELPRHHAGGEEREQAHERHHQRQPLAQDAIGSRQRERRAPGLPGAPLHESSTHEEEGHPQKKTPARDPHGRLLQQARVRV